MSSLEFLYPKSTPEQTWEGDRQRNPHSISENEQRQLVPIVWPREWRMIKMLELNQAQTRIWIWWLSVVCALDTVLPQALERKRINKKGEWMSHCIIVHQNPLTWHSLASGQGKQNNERQCIIIVHSLDSCILSLVNLVYMGWFFCCMSMSF